MHRGYFEYNGKRYYTGTVLIVKYMSEEVEATFICYDEQSKYYVCKIRQFKMWYPESQFFNAIIRVTDTSNNSVHMPQQKVKKDTHIDGLFIGWVWYIFLMGISTIFKDAFGLWIFISIVFFNWRKKKIEEEGTYIEW